MTTLLGARRGAALVLGLSLVCLQCHPGGRPAVERQPPTIVVNADTHDFGRVEQGTLVTAAFAFRNGGDLALRVDDVRAACACTTTVRPRQVLAPGEQSQVEVVFDTAEVIGPTTRTLTVYSNDPARPVTTLTLTGVVTADVTVERSSLHVGHVRRGQAAGTVRVLAERGGRGLFGPLETDGMVIKPTLVEDTTGPHVRFSVRPDAPLGPFTESVTLRTNSAARPRLRVRVTGVVDGDVRVSPARLVFGPVAVGQQPSRTVMVRNDGARPVRVTAAVLEPPIGDARVTTERDGWRYRITVTLRQPLSHRISATLQVRTDAAEQSVVAVPVSGRRAGPAS